MSRTQLDLQVWEIVLPNPNPVDQVLNYFWPELLIFNENLYWIDP